MPPRSRLRLVDAKKKPEAAAEWIDPKLLVPWRDNPRINDHVVQGIVDSIRTYGFGKPILARRVNREVIAGHATLKAVLQLKLDRVPVRFLDLNEEMSHQLALADNRLGELAKWDMSALNTMLSKLPAPDLSRVGWSDKDMAAIQATAAGTAQDAEEDDIPAPRARAVTQPGDLWVLGEHRIVCGDSTNAKHVALAIGDRTPWIMVTDPPYGVAYDPNWRVSTINKTGVRGMGGVAEKNVAPVPNDNQARWPLAFDFFKGDVAYVYCASQLAGYVQRDLEALKLECRAMLIWRKPAFVIGRGHYHWQHEALWYAVRSGSGAKWVGGRKQSTVWDIAGLGVFGGSQDELDAATGHGTQKPVECMARPMRNHGRAGDVVYDPFLGSGTSVVAAEQLDRRCVALELQPLQVDVAIERWQRLSGGKAKRSAA